MPDMSPVSAYQMLMARTTSAESRRIVTHYTTNVTWGWSTSQSCKQGPAYTVTLHTLALQQAAFLICATAEACMPYTRALWRRRYTRNTGERSFAMSSKAIEARARVVLCALRCFFTFPAVAFAANILHVLRLHSPARFCPPILRQQRYGYARVSHI